MYFEVLVKEDNWVPNSIDLPRLFVNVHTDNQIKMHTFMLLFKVNVKYG